MYKACSKCGRIHKANEECPLKRTYKITEESKLRNTYKWHTKAEEIKERSKYLCSVCKDKGRYTYKGLETHHIEKVKDRPDLLIDDSNLICLCVECHKKADAGDIDKEYLHRLAEERDR